MTTRHLPIKDWPQTEQPREKLLNKGPDTLSDAELLAIFLRTGIPGKSAITIARDALLEAGSLRRLLNMSPVDLCKFKGVGTAKYVQFQAGLELGRRYLKEQLEKGTRITSPDISRDYLTLQLRDKPYEAFYVMYLNSKHSVIHSEELFRGTIDSASVPIREVVKEALKFNAAALIVAHNHPSGITDPSQADISLTQRLISTMELIGVRALDHIIVANNESRSLAELGHL